MCRSRKTTMLYRVSLQYTPSILHTVFQVWSHLVSGFFCISLLLSSGVVLVYRGTRDIWKYTAGLAFGVILAARMRSYLNAKVRVWSCWSFSERKELNITVVSSDHSSLGVSHANVDICSFLKSYLQDFVWGDTCKNIISLCFPCCW